MTDRDDIDFANSRAVLLGTTRYDGFGQVAMPAAGNSLQEMNQILTGAGRWPSSCVVSFQDLGSKDAPLEQIASVFHAATDVLIFYYVGHGQLLVGNDLGLALTDTSEERRRRLSTSLRLSNIRLELDHNCDARVKILILDCCFSGIATKYAQGPDASAAVQAAAELDGEGTYTWTACGHTQDAYFESGQAGKTYFTKFIGDVVRSGIAGGRPGLTISEVNREVRKRLRSAELDGVPIKPEPSLLFKGTVDSFILAPNAAVSTNSAPNASPMPPTSEPEVESAAERRSRHQEALRAWESGTPPTNKVTLQLVHYMQFTTVRLIEGYDEDEVDALLDRVEEALIYYEGQAGRF